MAKKQSLKDWISEARTDSEKEGGCVKIALMHRQGGMSGMRDEPVWAASLGADKQKWTDEDLAKVLQNKAESCVQDKPGNHEFSVHAMYGTEPEPQAKRSLMVHIASDEGSYTENPTPSGALAQTMRQKEDFFKSMMGHQLATNRANIDMVNSMGAIFVQMGRAITEERQATAAIMNENREATAIIKDMLMKQVADTHARDMERQAYIRQTEERRKLFELAPVLVNQLTGTEVFPQSKADSVLIEQIAAAFDKMDETTLQGMMSVIPQDLMGPLMARFVQWKKDKEEDAKRIASLNPPVRSPEHDAAGEVQPPRMGAAPITRETAGDSTQTHEAEFVDSSDQTRGKKK